MVIDDALAGVACNDVAGLFQQGLGSMELDGETEVVVDSVTEITVEGLVSQYGRKTLSLIADGFAAIPGAPPRGDATWLPVPL